MWVREWWPVIAFGLFAVWGVLKLIDRLRSRLDAQDAKIAAALSAHDAHEDICGERYAAIHASHQQLVSLTKERHDALERMTERRHEENGERFDKFEAKLDRLLERA